MKNLNASIAVSFLLLGLTALMKELIPSLLVLGYLVILFTNLKTNKFKDNILKLSKANQVYKDKEEKLNLVFGPSNDLFEDRCQILKSKAKSSLERSFYHDLSLCNNKTQIENLIESYLVLLSRNEFDFLVEILLGNTIFTFMSFYYKNLINVQVFQIINIVCLLVLIIKKLDHQSISNSLLMSTEKKFYIKFFIRLSYLSPMVSLKETIDEFELSGSIYNKLFDDINENQISNYPKKTSEVTTCLYKILANNKYNHEPLLFTAYLKINEDSFFFSKFVEDYYFIFQLLAIFLGYALQ